MLYTDKSQGYQRKKLSQNIVHYIFFFKLTSLKMAEQIYRGNNPEESLNLMLVCCNSFEVFLSKGGKD